MQTVKTVTVFECDQCKRNMGQRSYWHTVGGRENEKLTFCGKVCAEKYRDIKYPISEYDSDKANWVMGNTD